MEAIKAEKVYKIGFFSYKEVNMIKDIIARKEYKKMIIEWIDTEYTNLWDTFEYKNIMKNINKIVKNVFPKIDDTLTLEEEMNIVWNEIDKYKEELK